MESSEELPVLAPTPTLRPRLAWVLHLLILSAYPLGLSSLSYLLPLPKSPGQTTLIPTDPFGLLQTISLQFLIFAVVFALAWMLSRSSPDQLMLRWKDGSKPIWRGALYSIGLRLFIFAVVMALVLLAFLFSRLDAQTLKQLRPQTEHVVDPQTLASSPTYLILNVTLVSFVFAGFREELWRAGMLAALVVLFPRLGTNWVGKLTAVTLVAVVFGLGHLPQGWGGVAMTAVLGFGLGLIMLYHNSIWEAVFAHGFFNATTFLFLSALVRYWPEVIGGK